MLSSNGALYDENVQVRNIRTENAQATGMGNS